MRPRKKVLLFGLNEDELGAMGYVMWSRHYAVTLATGGSDAMNAIATTEFECAVVLGRDMTHVAEAIVLALSAARPELPVVLVVPKGCVPGTRASVLIHGGDVARLLEAVRLLCVRKRGPKKASEWGIRNVERLQSALQRVG